MLTVADDSIRMGTNAEIQFCMLGAVDNLKDDIKICTCASPSDISIRIETDKNSLQA